ncbi:hypothetical protein OFR22_11875 [Brachyspira hyodysenteriae]|uniref:hypothetical protein n=1 Tax=Brachyspira hyodysenteriae TaxID=159 RepID=UPI0022CD7D07|nr:hypothetical protein [Brachyspira hyodysenteriae]MCZ9840355.1 hypothetical protein [Brachyspira hyodysenteriae]MCZ9848743.1 hypothetical protein [Brachyspira hyodysenteriae]MCZ9872103.1 hypothetical protein [Brachyspira hyodysenteriae]MCZ9875806.1 hypothetical protein [Brachyspira hyodysenteriae]MCZ9928949.1 hypothetical protein [Brachyspira hyodysenteriae]
MKKIIFSLLISLFFISCLDFTQYITIDENENITVVLIGTISKSLVELAAYSEGYENGVPDYYYEEILRDMESEARTSYPRNFKFKRINNDNEIGLYINGIVKGNDVTEYDNSLLPVRDGNRFIFTPPYFENTSEYQEYESMYSSIKIKLIVSKDYIPRISSCYLSSYYEVKDVNVYDLKDAFLIEIPIFSGLDSPVLYIEL